MQSPTPRPGGTLARLILAGVALALVGAIATAAWAIVELARSGSVRGLFVGTPPPGPASPSADVPPASRLITPPPEPAARRPAVLPAHAERDVGLTPEQAFLELRRAIAAEDAPRAAAFVLAQKLAGYGDEAALLADIEAIRVTDVRVRKSKRNGERAVVFVDAMAPEFTDAAGRALAAPAVVRLVREEQRWKLFSQLWLISTDTTEAEREALAWLAEDLSGQGPAADARRRLAALGLTADVDTLVAATARHELANVELLLAAGVSPNVEVNGTSAWSLVMIGLDADPVNEAIALRMLAAGGDLGYRTPTRMGPLPLAVSACRLELVEALLRAGADPNAADGHGLTPLRWAQQSCPAAVAPLRRAGPRSTP